MFDMMNLFGRHELDVWREEHARAAAIVLNEVAVQVFDELGPEIEKAGWKACVVNRSAFIAARVEPLLRRIGDPVVAMLLEAANRELKQIAEHRAVWHAQVTGRDAADETREGWGDIALAAGPLAGGAATLAALPFAAVTTTTAWFGLITTTAISWPIVAGGSAVAGAALAAGLHNSVRILPMARDRLARKVRAHVHASLVQGTKGSPSILEQLIERYAEATRRAAR